MLLHHVDGQPTANGQARRRASSPVWPILIATVFLTAIFVTVYQMCAKPSNETALAVRLDEQHYPVVGRDFFRVSFLPLDARVETLGRKDVATRAFFAASSDFVPGVPLAEMVTYPGAADEPEKKLVAMRCKPADLSVVDPILATWPNVFRAITADFAGMKFSCPPKAAPAGASKTDDKTEDDKAKAEAEAKAEANKFFCAAQAFQDSAGDNATVVLSKAMDAAAATVASGDKAADDKAKNWLRDTYGIWPPFSGLGLSVKDSGSQNSMSMNAAVILSKSVTVEYLLKNVSLDQAGCRCISVAPYPGRSQDAIDPDFVWDKGDGSCASVKRLN